MQLCSTAVPWAYFVKEIGQLFRSYNQLDFLERLQIGCGTLRGAGTVADKEGPVFTDPDVSALQLGAY